jgi:hypothetical protein
MAKNEVAKKESSEVATVDWEQEMREAAKNVAKTERTSVGRINIQSGVMTYMDNALPDNTLDAIVVAFGWEHVYYEGRYKQGVVVPPNCFGLGLPTEEGEPPTMLPHDAVKWPVHSNCAECPNFEWGSDPDGGRGKACKEKRRLALIPYSGDVVDLVNSEMAVLTVPVTSVKNWGNYVNKLAATVQRPPWGVVTRIKVVPDSRTQFKVTFDTVDDLGLGPDALSAVHSRIAMAEQVIMTPYEMNPEQEQEEEGDKKY